VTSVSPENVIPDQPRRFAQLGSDCTGPLGLLLYGTALLLHRFAGPARFPLRISTASACARSSPARPICSITAHGDMKCPLWSGSTSRLPEPKFVDAMGAARSPAACSARFHHRSFAGLDKLIPGISYISGCPPGAKRFFLMAVIQLRKKCGHCALAEAGKPAAQPPFSHIEHSLKPRCTDRDGAYFSAETEPPSPAARRLPWQQPFESPVRASFRPAAPQRCAEFHKRSSHAILATQEGGRTGVRLPAAMSVAQTPRALTRSLGPITRRGADRH